MHALLLVAALAALAVRAGQASGSIDREYYHKLLSVSSELHGSIKKAGVLPQVRV